MKKGWALAAGGALLLVVSALALPGRSGGKMPGHGIALFRVERGTFLRTATAEGYLRAVETTPITLPSSIQGMQRLAWIAEDGAMVERGEVVARLDTTSMERDLADGRDELEQATLRARQAQDSGEMERRNLDREAALAEREAEQAETFAPRDPDIYSRREILDSEIDRDLAREKISNAREKGDAADRKGRSERDLIRLDRSQAELVLERARKGLAAAAVTAPHAGRLVLSRSWEGRILGAGSEIWPGQPLAELPDPGRLEARAFVLEADATGLKPGCPASMVVEAHPERKIAAKVTQVAPLARRRDPQVPVQYFETVLAPESDQGGVMKPGLRVRAEIRILETPGVLMVPPQAVFAEGGRETVFRKQGDRLVPVEVQVGERGLSRIVVLKGLSEGDEVALRDPRRATGEVLGGPPPSKKGPPAPGKTP